MLESPQTAKNNRYAINADWLMKLRWVAVIGQLSTIAVVFFALQISVRITPLLVALATTTLTNLIFTLWLRRLRRGAKWQSLSESVWHRVFMFLLVLDLVVLASLLFFTGGHANPFSLFYFVNLALSGILLPPSRAWFLNVLSILCFAVLLYYQVPIEALQRPEHLQSIREVGYSTLGHRGLFVAFATCSAVIVYFVTRLNTELRRGDAAVRSAQMLRARSDKWEALGTLSAGAAHELATPLTTIAVLVKELQRELSSTATSQQLVEDFQVIRREVDRCRTILDRMSIDAGHATAENETVIDAESLLLATIEELPADQARVRLTIAAATKPQCVEVPLHSVLQAQRGVIQNALDASDGMVDVRVSHLDGFVRIEVVDHGVGMTEEVLKRADDPFFTTKEAGKGMGLGRFIARTVFERLGGSMVTESQIDVGTSVTISIPLWEGKE